MCVKVFFHSIWWLRRTANGALQERGLRRGEFGAFAGSNLKHSCKFECTNPSRPLRTLRIRSDNHRSTTQDLQQGIRRRLLFGYMSNHES